MTAVRQWQPSLADPNVRVEGLSELHQSIAIVLSTPVGSVAGNPELGSRLDELVDAPVTVVRGRAPAEVQRALGRWEPRVEVLETIVMPSSDDGHFELEIYWRPAGTDMAAQRTVVRV